MQHPKVVDSETFLAELAAAGVEFIVVGGAAALLHGAPITTQDLDIVHQRSPENVARLLDVLLRLDAVFRYDLANRRLRPTAELLSGRGQLNLSTMLGPIDPLCELGEGQGYEELLPHTVVMTDGDLTLRVLDLPTLIDVKSKTGRAKDRAVLPVLLATLEESSKMQP
ncbi:hypothetical protein [Polyangium sp. 15x6]|uniref:hypothetical protein n=1 Tax=Polyangium sp. 15x6 TaxID=3042687 RepID=UPI00249C7BDE|nr:hypothetical protein [Polyangium sp. 15x6]MDI3290050.1 hypothetical protein [Polyangium sp. 15x6]